MKIVPIAVFGMLNSPRRPNSLPRPGKPPQPKPKALRRAAPVSPRLALPSAKTPPVVQPPVATKHAWLAYLCAIVLLGVGAGAIGGSAWLAIQLMVEPQRLLWMNQFVPDWIPFPIAGVAPPQTLTEIQQDLSRSGAIAGEPLPLGKNVSFDDGKTPTTDVLLPVLKRRSSCRQDCDRVVELRVYQTSPKQPLGNRQATYQLVTRRAIASPEESFVIAPLTDAKSDNQGSTRPLPLTQVQRFEGLVPKQGVWLNLSGKWNRADETVLYGKILHYNPQRFYLSPLLDWTSPAAQEPIWQQVTDSSVPELVVNQTIGMEPRFKIYQVKPLNFLPNPVQLEAISLFEPALNQAAYSKALMMARNGLWSSGWQQLQTLKQQGTPWSSAAQAQLDLIRLHAQATQMQADSAWASPSQQALAALGDGRWQEALQVFTASADNQREIGALLKVDLGRLRKRIETALKVAPKQSEVKTWGALLVAAQQGRSPALAWLKKQSQTSAAEEKQILVLVDQLIASLQ